ncbi:MAG: hypothetical protein JNK95_02415 [Candidatus Competibacter sp.]|nr:hypothetical protein [Candidatus Competibacter sp.]MDG4607095.1 hypothetical protein [Candidatus Contendobacter sp.]HRD48084.1 hypothetical protein [Candidatus Contendobacter sp.]
MAIGTYREYQHLTRITDLEAGDLLLKKVFPETCKGAVEWGITQGQRLFSGDNTIKTGGLFSREKFRIAFNGSHTSEHAAVAISADELAEAVGEGVITASVRGRRDERYCVYRCLNVDLRNAAVMIAKGLSSAYHNMITGSPEVRNTTGGKYSVKGALASNFRSQQFQQGATHAYLTHVVDYVYGVRHDRPNMFCSEFAMTCYEAGSLAAFGKTAFGTNPIGMSPMFMEDVLNSRPDLMALAGKYDSENDVLFSAVEAGLRNYKNRKHFWNRLGISEASKRASEVLQNLMHIGDNDYLLAALAAFLSTTPTGPLSIRCNMSEDWRLSPDSSLYGDLVAQMKPTGLLAGL